jgi:ATP-dependent Lon protease
VDRPVAQRVRERVVDEAVLLQQREAVECRARDGHLEVIAATGTVFDAQLGGIGKRALEQLLERFGRHAAIVARRVRSTDADGGAGPVAAVTEELGLFPLGIVLVPTERVPLHIFEPRYQDLIRDCLEHDREFGLVLEDDAGTREVGTRAAVVEVIDRFDDGRLNIAIEGRQRFRVVAETSGHSYRTAEVEPIGDESGVPDRSVRDRALELYRALGRAVETEIDEPNADAGLLSFELAARVDFGTERKQELLELQSEPERLSVVSKLLERAAEAITLEQALSRRASTNGSGLSH